MTALSGELHDRTITPAVTAGPITGSRKVYRQVGELRVPARRVTMTNGEHVDLYDTSGPYTDHDATIDVHRGLPKLREPWIAAREPTPAEPAIRPQTQLAWARAG